jgi:nicotinate dehydrogenase subunit B
MTAFAHGAAARSSRGLLAWKPVVVGGAAGHPARTPPARLRRRAGRARRVGAALGDCIECHTAPDGKPYAGGRALQTPFGTIYGTNITPDPATGIGAGPGGVRARHARRRRSRGPPPLSRLSVQPFRRVSDADLQALYAFLMTRDAVEATVPSNRLTFPFNCGR